jgi:hypothetical protein
MSTGLLELLQSYALNPSTPARLASEAVSMAITAIMMDLASASLLLPCPLGLDLQATDWECSIAVNMNKTDDASSLL